MTSVPSFTLDSVSSVRALTQQLLSITITGSSSTQDNDKQNKVISIFLDRSSSMGGNPLNSAKSALSHAIDETFLSFEHIYLVLFDDDTITHYLSSTTPSTARNIIKKTSKGYGTNFLTTFDQMRIIIEKHSSCSHTVVYMTDGCDTSHLYNHHDRNQAIVKLQLYLRNNSARCTIHSIGFSRYHDATMLTALANGGSTPGTFIYVAQANEIESAFNEVFQETNYNSYDANLVLRDSDGNECSNAPTSLKFQIDSTNGTKYTACVLLPSDCEAATAEILFTANYSIQGKISVGSDKEQKLCSKDLDKETRAKVSLEYATDIYNILNFRICHDISQVALRKGDSSYLKGLHREYKFFSATIIESVLPRLKSQKQAKQKVIEVLSLINQFYKDVLVDSLRYGGFENEKYAELASMAYGNIRNQRLQKVLGKRIGKNINWLDTLDEEIEAALGTINFNDPGLFVDSDVYGQCVLSFTNYKEALEAGDCLCIGLEIRRPEVAIVQASRLIVNKVCTTMICAESFLNAVRFGISQENVDDAEEVHGGFDIGSSGTVIVGQSREILNGALPLFINEEHWKIARLQQKPIFGWMTTLDVLGFSHEQIITIPFLVLKTLHENRDDSEYKTRIESWVFETCSAVLKEAINLQETMFVRNQGEGLARLRYLTEPCARAPDVVPSNEVFCYQLYVAMKIKDMSFTLTVNERNTLGMLITVEETRRRMKNRCMLLSWNEKEEQIGRLLGFSHVDLNSLLDELSSMYDSGMTFEKCFDLLSVPLWKESWVRDIGEKANEMFESIYKTISFTLGDLNCLSTMQKCAVTILNLDNPRSESLKRENYKADIMLSLSNPILFMRQRFDQLLKSKLGRVYNEISKTVNIYGERKNIKKFLEADELDGVEELLQSRLWIGRNVGYYARAIAGIPIGKGVDVQCEVVHPLKKIGMLMNGLYMQNQLYLDQDNEKRRTLFDGLAWKPSKRYVRRWFARFVMNVIDDEKESEGQGAACESVVEKWKKLFPWLEREISIWGEEIKAKKNMNFTMKSVDR